MMRIQIEDYKIIRKADGAISGITVVYGANGAGKSTLLDAVKTVIENSSEESQYRHGQNAFKVTLDVGGNVLQFGRKEGSPWFIFGDGMQRTKLGHATMAELEPQFPLKRIEYIDSHFIPNIAEQNKVPIFGDISVVDLFSTLFGSMAKLSQRGSDLKKEVTRTSSSLSSVGANLDFTKTKKLEYEALIKAEHLKYPQLEDEYGMLARIHERKRKLADTEERIRTLTQTYGDPEKIRMVAKVEAARPLFQQFQYMQNVSQLVEFKRTVSEGVDAAKAQAGALPSGEHLSLVSSIGPLEIERRKLQKLLLSLAKIPENLDLVSLMGEIRKAQNSIKDYGQALVRLDEEYGLLDKRLSSIGCPIAAKGLCKWQKAAVA